MTQTKLVIGFDNVFIEEARKAAKRAADAATRDDAGTAAGATATAVLLSAAACEARLAEYVTRRESEFGTEFVAQVRDQSDLREQWKQVVKEVASDFDLGTKEFLALGCLFKLRNLVAHRHAKFLPLGKWPKELQDCIAQKAIPVDKTGGMDWTSATYVHEVAEWAHQTAAKWLATMAGLGIVATK